MSARRADARISRRALLRAGGLTLLAGGLPLGISACDGTRLADSLAIAGGEEGGLYLEFATLLAEALVRHDIARQASTVRTRASAENLQLLLEDRAQLGLALVDTVDQSPAVAGGQLKALGRVYQNYFHVLVRREDPIRSLSDLAGRRLSTGAEGSGTWLTGQRILRAAGLKGPRRMARERRLGLNDSLRELAAGTLDAMMISGGIAIDAVAKTNQATPLRLLDLGSVLPALRDRHPGLYSRVVIPQDTYAGMPPVHTVGVANLLMCRAQMPDDLVAATVQLLIERAGELVPSSSAGIQFLSPDNLVATAGQPLHPAAAETYRRIHG